MVGAEGEEVFLFVLLANAVNRGAEALRAGRLV